MDWIALGPKGGIGRVPGPELHRVNKDALKDKKNGANIANPTELNPVLDA